jgi:hypothetical protein
MPMSIRVTALCAIVTLGACIGDTPRKPIIGNYCLEEWPDFFVVVGCTFTAQLRGRVTHSPLDGDVLRLGWNDRFIVAQRRATSGGAVAWMILDAKAESLEGPLTEAEAMRRVAEDDRLRAVHIQDARVAWDSLHYSSY